MDSIDQLIKTLNETCNYKTILGKDWSEWNHDNIFDYRCCSYNGNICGSCYCTILEFCTNQVRNKCGVCADNMPNEHGSPTELLDRLMNKNRSPGMCLDCRLDNIEEALDEIDDRLDKISYQKDKKIEQLSQQIQDLSQRLKNLEKQTI